MGWGGQEIRILAEMTGLRSRGHRMLLAAPSRSRIFDRCREEGFDVFPISAKQGALPYNAVRLARWFGHHGVEIVNPHSSRDAWAAGLGGRLAGVPLVIRSRHFEVPIANRFLSRLVYVNLADHLVTTSPKISGQFRQAFQLPEERVSTVSTGIDLAVYSAEGPQVKFPAPRGQSKWPLVGMVAVLRHAKGHVFLVRAATELRNRKLPIRLVFVGDGPSKQPIVDEIQKRGLTDSVTFTGHRDDVPAILRSMDCAVFPSLHEGIPQTALQAMATGVPVVGSDAGGIPSVIQDGVTGRIFPTGNAEKLADCLEAVFRDRKRTEALCAKARACVTARHGLDQMLDQLEALYQRLLGSGR